MESKEDIIKRIGRSPDKGDSAVYALAVSKPPQPARFFHLDFMQR